GPALKARCYEAQKTEAKIGLRVLNSLSASDALRSRMPNDAIPSRELGAIIFVGICATTPIVFVISNHYLNF
ncbi:hypothetical protein, partial [Roseibium sp. RKSG952]|uniref:hypothetical protein n=1 Tax=Roseibium sp. RKSG952 TaxID=2529384 RepID=UPI001AD8B685